jgi:hypothetical protein
MSFSHAMRTARRRSLPPPRGAASPMSPASSSSSGAPASVALAPAKMGDGWRDEGKLAARRGRGVGVAGRKVAAAAIGGDAANLRGLFAGGFATLSAPTFLNPASFFHFFIFPNFRILIR